MSIMFTFVRRNIKTFYFLPLLFVCWGMLNACQSVGDHRKTADQVGYDIIRQKQMESLGHEESFTIDRPQDLLRRRLMADQNLPYKKSVFLHDNPHFPVKHWPDPDYFNAQENVSSDSPSPLEDVIQINLNDALKIGAQNSFDYQSLKEDIFRKALDLDLARDQFRSAFNAQVENLYSEDHTGDTEIRGNRTSGDAGIQKVLKNGISFTTAIAVDLANLLTGGGASALGIVGDASISIPLLRGAGKHIAAEPLTQAEQNVIYAIHTFERYKRTFAVNIARSYLSVLTIEDQVHNNEENCRSLIRSAKRARRRADAGRQTEIQVDQAVQDELRARDRWINTQEAYSRTLDDFKILLGLPPDARIELERGELERLKQDYGDRFSVAESDNSNPGTETAQPTDDDPTALIPPDPTKAGPLEFEYNRAITIALEHRLDLQTAVGKYYDAQRKVVVLADGLGAELTLLGTADFGENRTINSATLTDASLHKDRGLYSALMTLDLPLERTYERNAYRKGLIDMERALRDVQKLEDDIKRAVRSKLGDLLKSRESIGIQTRAVALAQKRVNMTQLFLEAGRTQIRDVLEAQSSLLSAQNALTSAVANYRVAELELQRDLGVLKVDEMGIWQEYLPEEDI